MRARATTAMLLWASTLTGSVNCGQADSPKAEVMQTVNTGEWVPAEAKFSAKDDSIAFLGRDRLASVSDVFLAASSKTKGLLPANSYATNFDWMPDGTSILVAYHTSGTMPMASRFAIIGIDGKLERDFAPSEPLFSERGIAVRSDGAIAIFAAQQPSEAALPNDLYTLDLANGNTNRLTDSPTADESYPSYLSDKDVVFTGGVSTTTAPAAGPNGWIGTLHLRTGVVDRLATEGQTVGSASTTFGGAWVVYDAFPDNRRSEQAIWRRRLSDGGAQLLLKGPYRFPHVSVDGKRLLVTRIAGSPNETTELQVIKMKPLD